MLKEDVELFKTLMNEKVMKTLKQIKHQIWLQCFYEISIKSLEIENNDCEVQLHIMNKEIDKNIITLYERNVNLLVLC